MEPIILPRISDIRPLVSVISITYNHEPYIKDCLEGFLMQKTDFPIEIIIHDDASTDHTADILLEYYKKRPDLFHIIIESDNQFSQGKGICLPLYKEAQGKYIALCEGDDYWVDPLKLQKQFDFMESHDMYSSTIHNYNQKDELTGKTIPYKNLYRFRRNILLSDIIRNGTSSIHVCTLFFRKETIKEYYTFKRKCPVGDYALFMCLATQGMMNYDNTIMATYRYNSVTSWSKRFNHDPMLRIKHCRKGILWLKEMEMIVGTNNKDFSIAKGEYYFNIYKETEDRKCILGNKHCLRYIANKPVKTIILTLLWLFFPKALVFVSRTRSSQKSNMNILNKNS